MPSIPEFTVVCHSGLGAHGEMEPALTSQLEKPRETFGAIPEHLGWEKPRGWFELSGTEQAEKGRAGSGIVSASREEGAGSNSEPQTSSRGPKIPAGIPELVSRSFSGGCNGKQQPRISGRGHVSSGLGQSRGSHELLLWQIPAPRGTGARQFPWKQERSSWNARGEVDAGMERG